MKKRNESNLPNMLLALTLVSCICATLLAFIYKLTYEPIQTMKKEATAAAVRKVIVGGQDSADILVGEPVSRNGFVLYGVTDPEGQLLGTAVESTVSGFGGPLKVMVGFNPDGDILGYDIIEHSETPGLGANAATWFKKHSIIGMNPGDSKLALKKNGGEVDAITAATITSNAFLKAINEAYHENFGFNATDGVSGASLAARRYAKYKLYDEETVKDEKISFIPGEYFTEGEGFGGKISVKTTFSKDAVTDIKILSHKETAHIGDMALPLIIDEIKRANGLGVDAVSGASFTSFAVKEAVAAAARQAGLADNLSFMTNTTPKLTAETEGTWDVVIIGGGGAGLAAAAQAAQDGNTVLVIEKNAEVGGNTLVSGGMYQAIDHSLVWDPARPDAKTATGFDGKMHDKVKATVGSIAELKVILDWSEAPFDEEYYKTHEFVAGDTKELSKHGVHAEFLPVLRELKSEIRQYLAYAEPRIAAGTPENSLVLFSPTMLHVFQTYYGGLRQDMQKSGWIYGDKDLIEQFVREGEGLKPWLMDMGVRFNDAQTILVGALWYRCNVTTGCRTDLDGDGTPEDYSGNWGTYVAAPLATMLNASAENKVLRSTSAENLIFEGGRVVGVKATSADGTKVTAHARKGVIIATGGYAANIEKVLKTNRYWSRQYLSPIINTTNRSSMKGDGIRMAQEIGASVTGMGFTQLLPLAYAVDGMIAMGGVENAVFISPKDGKRFVDECTERDVISLSAFRNGVETDAAKGAYLYITRTGGQMSAGMTPYAGVIPGKEWSVKASELEDFFEQIGLDADAAAVRKTITEYDMDILEGREIVNPGKLHPIDIIGEAEKDKNGKYDPSTYSLDNTELRIRVLAPATHHTMGGLRIDLERHVLDENGSIIPGLYAAGEVTGGIFAGNRLGGNALTEVLVSGRIAARSLNRQ